MRNLSVVNLAELSLSGGTTRAERSHVADLGFGGASPLIGPGPPPAPPPGRGDGCSDSLLAVAPAGDACAVLLALLCA